MKKTYKTLKTTDLINIIVKRSFCKTSDCPLKNRMNNILPLLILVKKNNSDLFVKLL